MSRKQEVLEILKKKDSYLYEIHKELGINRQQVKSILDSLVADGLIEKCESKEVSAGPPRQYYRIKIVDKL